MVSKASFTERIRPRGIVERMVRPNNIPGKEMSSAYFAPPVALPIPSFLATLFPTAAILVGCLCGWLHDAAGARAGSVPEDAERDATRQARAFRWTEARPPVTLKFMSSLIAITESLRRAAAGGEAVVLATVVRVVGSSYGGVGARMLIRVDGTTVGLVSGGCLESDLCAHAVEVHASGLARVVSYDTRADDDAVWGLGLGCNGLIDVLLQPVSPPQAAAVADLLASALSVDPPAVLATVTQSSPSRDAPAVGAQALFTNEGKRSVGDWGDGTALASAAAHIEEARSAGRRGLVHEVGSTQIAFEVVAPVIRLVVCGSGPDAAPVCRLAANLGWNVTLIDHRPVTEAHAARFPGTRVIECAEPATLSRVVALTERTAAVVMSHHFARDAEYLKALIAGGVAYVGVLGPRPRTERMLAELATRGEEIPSGASVLFGPVGLDLGGDGPEAIALAIVSEVSAVMHGRAPGHLRDACTALHDTAAAVTESRLLR